MRSIFALLLLVLPFAASADCDLFKEEVKIVSGTVSELESDLDQAIKFIATAEANKTESDNEKIGRLLKDIKLKADQIEHAMTQLKLHSDCACEDFNFQYVDNLLVEVKYWIKKAKDVPLTKPKKTDYGAIKTNAGRAKTKVLKLSVFFDDPCKGKEAKEEKTEEAQPVAQADSSASKEEEPPVAEATEEKTEEAASDTTQMAEAGTTAAAANEAEEGTTEATEEEVKETKSAEVGGEEPATETASEGGSGGSGGNSTSSGGGGSGAGVAAAGVTAAGITAAVLSNDDKKEEAVDSTEVEEPMTEAVDSSSATEPDSLAAAVESTDSAQTVGALESVGITATSSIIAAAANSDSSATDSTEVTDTTSIEEETTPEPEVAAAVVAAPAVHMDTVRHTSTSEQVEPEPEPEPVVEEKAEPVAADKPEMKVVDGAPAVVIPVNVEFFYAVQITTGKANLGESKYTSLNEDIYSVKENGMTKYRIGKYSSISEAVATKKKAFNGGFLDAFVVAYKNGKRITIPEARKIEAANKSGKQESSPYEKSAKIKKNSNVILAVQVGAHFTASDPAYEVARYENKLGMPIESLDGQPLRFYTGSATSDAEAKALLKKVKAAGIDKAFLIGISDGKRIPYQEAVAHLTGAQ